MRNLSEIVLVTVAVLGAVMCNELTVRDMCQLDVSRRLICIDPITIQPFEYMFYTGKNMTIMDVTKIEDPGSRYLRAAYGSENITSIKLNRPLDRRMNWADCNKNKGYLTWTACETSHIIGSNWAGLGYGALQTLIDQYVLQAFSSGRDNQNPRSICHNYDGQQMCVSWAVYSPHGMYSGELYDVTNFATYCAMKGDSAEMRVNLISGVAETICVSNRSDGCTMSPTDC